MFNALPSQYGEPVESEGPSSGCLELFASRAGRTGFRFKQEGDSWPAVFGKTASQRNWSLQVPVFVRISWLQAMAAAAARDAAGARVYST